jgi:DNA-binding NtrC family response regulator
MTILRILCVHEDESVLDDLGRVLQAAGYETVAANDGRSALRILERERVDGIVLNYEMRAPDGRSLRNQVQHLHPNLPMLLFFDVDEIRNMPLHVFGAYLEHPEVSALALMD